MKSKHIQKVLGKANCFGRANNREVILSPAQLASLVVNPWLKLVPVGTSKEFDVLSDSVSRVGVIQPIVVCGNELLDGQARVAHCIKHNQPLKAYDFYAADETERIQIVLGLNLGRSSPTTGQKAMVAVGLLQKLKGLSLRAAARMVGVTHPVVRQALIVSNSKLLDIISKVKSGQMDVGAAARAVREHIAKAKVCQTAASNPANQVELRFGRFQDRLTSLPDESVDAIITDPLYFLECRPDWSDLGEFTERKLKVGGVLVLMVGSFTSDEMLMAVRSKAPSLQKVGNFSAVFKGKTTNHPGRRVIDEKRDYLVYVKTDDQVKCPKTVNGSPHTLLHVSGADTLFSTYGQKPEAFSPFIEWYTNPGDLVVDPFSGGGAVPAACQQLGRRCLAAECDMSVFSGIVGRFFGATPQDVRASRASTWGKVSI